MFNNLSDRVSDLNAYNFLKLFCSVQLQSWVCVFVLAAIYTQWDDKASTFTYSANGVGLLSQCTLVPPYGITHQQWKNRDSIILSKSITSNRSHMTMHS